jgi:hypothetical protein
LHLVAIDLEKEDDAQEIFETLNALGTPLLTADLVKNYLFRLANRRKENTEKLYEQFWATYDEDKGYWREQVRQGRLKRPRIDTFLHHYLTLRTAQEINATHLFSTFRDFVVQANGDTVSKHMGAFRSYSDVYRTFDSYPPNSREALFFYRLEQLDTTTVYPLLLELFKRFSGADSKEELEQIIVDLESYFVRRSVCELTTKNYNRLFVDVIKTLKEKNDFSASALRRVLFDGKAETSLWPSDQQFSTAWASLAFYKRLKRTKTRMILEAVEAALYTKKTEQLNIPTDLTIEHLMPREWERHWPLVLSEQTTVLRDKAGQDRDALINRIGNLTLITRNLNPAISNGPWSRKRAEILRHSALNLNRDLPEDWNEAEIQKRSEELLHVALKIWPRPEAMLAQVA